MTEAKARTTPARRLGEYVREPQIALRIQTYRSKHVYLDGGLHTPGLQLVNDVPMTLLEAIDRAGGLTTAAGVIRSSIVLRDGDLVRVHAAGETKVFVPGEVPRPAMPTLTDGR
ncbi:MULTISPECIES: hypothetical protein [Burkholderia]|uniref:hypothetical protein n=1 Tax=Burkholderia TaxID=32008 RepID=UPI001F12119C|nr:MULTISPECIES: hypothetical protein [Burkholderia]